MKQLLTNDLLNIREILKRKNAWVSRSISDNELREIMRAYRVDGTLVETLPTEVLNHAEKIAFAKHLAREKV